MPTIPKAVTYFAALAPQRVDVENGTVTGMCLMKVGPAKGHGTAVDGKTLDMLVGECSKLGNIDFVIKHDGHPLEVIGDLSNFRRDGDTARADLDVYKSFPQRAQFLEIASRNPRSFGTSAEFRRTDETVGTTKFARVHEVRRFALERDTAASPDGLFSENHNPDDTDMTPEELTNAIKAANQPLLDRVAALETNVTKFGAKPEGDDAPVTKKELKEATEAAGLDALTKFAARAGIQVAPVNAADGNVIETNFAAKVKTIMGTGADKNTAVRTARKADEKGFEAFCKAGSKLD